MPYFSVSSKNCPEIVNFSDIIQEMVLKRYLAWLIWGTNNPVSKISENRWERDQKKCGRAKSLVATCCNIFFIFLHFKILENEKHEAALFN